MQCDYVSCNSDFFQVRYVEKKCMFHYLNEDNQN